MKMNRLYKALVFVAGICLVSCTPLGGMNENKKGKAVISGNISVEGMSSSTVSRARTATYLNSSWSSCTVSATSKTGGNTSVDVDENGRYLLDLDFGTWTIKAEAVKANGDSLSETVEVTLSEEQSVVAKDFLLKGVSDGKGKGSVNLPIAMPSTITSIETVCVSGNADEWKKVGVSISDDHVSAILSSGEVKITSGDYVVQFNFYKGENTSRELAFCTTQLISVYNNITTDGWFDDGSYKDENSDTGLFDGTPLVLTVTEDLMKSFSITTFYVCGTGSEKKAIASDSNLGSFLKPLATFDAAANKCVYDDVEYTIIVDGNVTCSTQVEINSAINILGLNENAQITYTGGNQNATAYSFGKNTLISGITFDGNGVTDESAFSVNIDEELEAIFDGVTIRNFKQTDSTAGAGGITVLMGSVVMNFCTIDSCESGGLTGGGAISVYGDGLLEMNNCTISNCNNTNGNTGGGGIWSEGEVTLANCKIYGCTANGNGGAIYLKGGSCTIDKNSVIGNVETVSTATASNYSNKASNNGGGVAVISGSFTNQGRIIGNYAVNNGGGIYGSSGSIENTGSIDGNYAGQMGGGISSTSVITLDSGTVGNYISNNSPSASGIYSISVVVLKNAAECKDVIKLGSEAAYVNVENALTTTKKFMVDLGSFTSDTYYPVRFKKANESCFSLFEAAGETLQFYGYKEDDYGDCSAFAYRTFYVSSSGSDSAAGAGTKEKPFKTVTAAMKESCKNGMSSHILVLPLDSIEQPVGATLDDNFSFVVAQNEVTLTGKKYIVVSGRESSSKEIICSGPQLYPMPFIRIEENPAYNMEIIFDDLTITGPTLSLSEFPSGAGFAHLKGNKVSLILNDTVLKGFCARNAGTISVSDGSTLFIRGNSSVEDGKYINDSTAGAGGVWVDGTGSAAYIDGSVKFINCIDNNTDIKRSIDIGTGASVRYGSVSYNSSNVETLRELLGDND